MSDTNEKIAISVPEMAALLGISKPKAYELCARSDFPCTHLGRRTLIHRGLLDEWLKQQCGQANSP